MDFISDLLLKNKIDLLAVSETWLLPSVPSSFVDVADYCVVRGDSDSTVRKHGSLLYLHEDFVFLSIEVDIPNVAAVHLVNYDLYIVSVYRPPSYSILENRCLIDFLLNFCPGKEVILTGDFNLPSIDWSAEVAVGYVRPVDVLFLDCFSSLGLIQWVKVATFVSSENILDLIFTSEPDRIGDVSVLPPLPRCHHSPVICDYTFYGAWRGHAGLEERRLWHKGRYADISLALSQVNWIFEFSYSSVNYDFSLLQSTVSSLIDKFVPMRPARSGPPWAVKAPAALVRERSEAWQSYKLVRSEQGRNSAAALEKMRVFNELNWNYRNFSIQCRKKYEADLLNRQDNRKLFHAYVRNKKIGRPTVGPIRLPNGELVLEPGRMSCIFADSFAGVFVGGTPAAPASFQAFEGSLDDVEFSRRDIANVLTALDTSSSMGPDGFHPYLLKSCAEEISFPLWLIFQKSMRTGLVPEIWSKSVVVPIFKAKAHTDPLNYRPVSLTSVCCKSMERIVASKLADYLEENDILSSHQYGFRRNRSTEDQLLLTYDDVGRWMDGGDVVDVILLDFSKAFDVVNHSVLLSMLQSLGVGGRLLTWIFAFLSGRMMSVCVDGCHSRPVEVTSGVPQGSVLGPLLFLVYINYVANDLSCSYKAFADDFKLYLKYPRTNSSQVFCGIRSLQNDLNVVDSVARSWNLALNPRKCVVMRYHKGQVNLSAPNSDGGLYYLQGRALDFVGTYRDLGVNVDTSLRFHQHVRVVVAKAGGLANNLLRSTVCRSAEFMMSLYVAHIRPLIEYASCVWNTGYLGDSRLLESVQRRWTRNIEGLDNMDYSDRLRELDLFSVKGRLLRADLIKYWKILHGESGCLLDMFSFAPRVGTRGHELKLVLPLCSSDARCRSFSVRCVNMWNRLPANIVNLADLAAFKCALSNWMYDEFLEYD